MMVSGRQKVGSSFDARWLSLQLCAGHVLLSPMKYLFSDLSASSNVSCGHLTDACIHTHGRPDPEMATTGEAG